MPAFAWAPSAAPNTAMVILVVGLVAAITLILGIFPRAAATCLAAIGVYGLVTDLHAYSNHLVLMISLSTIMAMSQSANAWAVGAVDRSNRVPIWPAVLIMVQISTVYFWTAVSKINSQYLSGEVLAGFVNDWVKLPLWVFSFVALASIAVELFLAASLWFGRTRGVAFLVGGGLHLGIVLLLSDPTPLVAFALLMMVGYAQFAALGPSWLPFLGRRELWSRESTPSSNLSNVRG